MDVFAEGSKRPIGKVTSGGHGHALALLRLQAAFSGAQLRAESKDGPVLNPQHPSWWPPGWGKEEQQED